MASTKLASSTVSPASAKAKRMPAGQGVSCQGWCHQLGNARGVLCLLHRDSSCSWSWQMQSQAQTPGQPEMPQRRHLPSLGGDRHQDQEPSTGPAQNTGAREEQGTHGDTGHTHVHSPCTPTACPGFWAPQGMQRAQAGCPWRAQPQEQLLPEPGVLTHIPIFHVELSFSTRTGGKWQIYCHSILQ